MSAIDGEIGTLMEAHALRRRWLERYMHADSRTEHKRQLALKGPTATVELDLLRGHLHALGVDVRPLDEAIDRALLMLLHATLPVLSDVRADTPEQEEGRKR